MTQPSDYTTAGRTKPFTAEIRREHANTVTGLSSVLVKSLELKELAPKNRGRPFGTHKRQIGSGVSHDRIDAIRAAILKLDPADIRLWSVQGHPKTAHLQKITGLPDVARWEIQMACPGIRRDKAYQYSVDSMHLTLARGKWRFQMKRKGEYLRRNLKTGDLKLARPMRDWYCISGNWDYKSPTSCNDKG